jgi:prepilin-type processing-associated H-X9-DG protein
VGWFYQILPYVEGDSIWRQLSDERWGNASGTNITSRSIVQVYFCPSRRAAQVSPNGRVLNDYASAMPGFGPGDPWGSVTDIVDPFFWGDGFDHGGVIARNHPQGRDVKLSFASILDGTANTIVVGEKWLRPDRYLSNDWMDNEGWCSGWDPDTTRMTWIPIRRDHNGPNFNYVQEPPAPQPPPPLGTQWGYGGRPRNGDEWRQGFGFGGAHSGGMNALYGDGSVRNTSYQINGWLFWRLGGRSDGGVVPDDPN